jgi:hypothetical protein
LTGHEEGLDIYYYTCTHRDFTLPFACFGINSSTFCGPLSNLNFHFIWDYFERLAFMKYAMILFPYWHSRPPILLFLKYHRARSGGWTGIDGCSACVERYQRDMETYWMYSSRQRQLLL